MDAASSAAMQALKIIDRDTLLAQLGVEARDDEEDEADDAEDDETLDEGDLDAPEPIRKAALRLGISQASIPSRSACSARSSPAATC